METYLIDTHTHIDEFEDLDEVIQNAKNSGVKKIIIPSADASSFDRVIEISEKYQNVYCALGIHPTELEGLVENDYDKIVKLSSHPKVVAIGECGLDYYLDKEHAQEQKEAFARQIKIAIDLKKPLIVHDREAHKDCFDMLKDITEIPIVMHCFSGSLEFAKECLKKGMYLAFGGVVTFKNAKKTHEVAKEMPLSRMLLETDAPYLTPVPFRGKRNEPAYVKLVAQKIANLRGVSFEEIAQATTENARKVFGI